MRGGKDGARRRAGSAKEMDLVLKGLISNDELEIFTLNLARHLLT